MTEYFNQFDKGKSQFNNLNQNKYGSHVLQGN